MAFGGHAGPRRLFRFLVQAADLAQHFVVLRESADVVLAPDLFAVHMHVEDAAGALDEFGLGPELLLDRFRQTGGTGEVVSLRAILDRDIHAWSLLG